jgi:hypothetical protein
MPDILQEQAATTFFFIKIWAVSEQFLLILIAPGGLI